METADLNINTLVARSIEDALKTRGKANILVAGKTGVGKSTLINGVFKGRMAATGQGRPITQNTIKITKDDIPVSIYDTRGIEVKDYAPIVADLLELIKRTNAQEDPADHIHVAWLCIAEGARRVEEAEILLAEQLSEKVPVVGVITTAVSDNGFRAEVKKLLPSLANVVRVNTVEQQLDGGITIPSHGLGDLVDLTMELVPEGQKNAFAASQKIKLDANVSRAHKIVAGASATALAAGVTPIPFSDALVLAPIQVSMLAGISAAFGLPLDRAFLGTLVSGSLAATAGTVGGRMLVTSLLKIVPGFNFAGMAVSGATAALLTTTFGEAYIATLYMLLKDNPEKDLAPEQIAEAFRDRLKGGAGKPSTVDSMAGA